METVWLIYHIVVIVMLLAVVANTWRSVTIFPRIDQPLKKSKETPLVSVLVPARNEESVIRECVVSLKSQEYEHFEVIVLDDRSEDLTGQILDEEGFHTDTSAQFRRIRGKPLPEGWAGKPWACAQLAKEANGEFILFTDADTVHEPHCVHSTVAYALTHETDLLSAWPLQVMKSWSEKWIIPLLYVLALALFPQWLFHIVQKDPQWFLKLPKFVRNKLGIANGQFMFFKREFYESFGGHEAVKAHLVEDVALGRIAFSKCGEGRKLINGDASTLLRCRMYQNLRGVWEGFSKNARPVFEEDIASLILIGVVQFTGFVVPFFIWPFAGPWLPFVLIQIALVILMRVLLTLRMKSGWTGVIFHPFAYVIAFAIVLNSWRWAITKQIMWKGRVYSNS